MKPPKRQRTEENDVDKVEDASTKLKNVRSLQHGTNGDTDDDQLFLEKKVFNDSVHGHIELHPLLVSIIDTPEFQRLRFIKQLGMCYFVYPGATHNRFEHSIGVSYLAGELARSLQSKQSELNITDKDVLCVEIAGLCHDLGHGPFSHLFDEAFLPSVRPDYIGKHEKLSLDMFEHMLKKNKLREKFKKKTYGLEERDIDFVKELIVGVEKQKVRAVENYSPNEESKELPISLGEMLTVVKQDTGEGYLEVVNVKEKTGLVLTSLVEDKSFLYEIVANKRNGIDVDKWDYFARDSLYLGISNPFDWRRYVKFARVLNGPDGMQICTRDKEINNLYDMFHTRYMLHQRAYQHKVNKILETMVVEVLKDANEHLQFLGTNGKMSKMSESIDDMEAYSKLTDHVMWNILSSTDENLEKSRELINRILKRDLFVCIGEIKLEKTVGPYDTPTKLVSQLIDVDKESAETEIYERFSSEAKKTVKPSDLIVHIVKFNYGKGEKDPVKHVKFYSKDDTDKTVEISKVRRNSMALPRDFSERFLRVIVKQSDPQVSEYAVEAFEKWCNDKGLKDEHGEVCPSMPPTKTPPDDMDRMSRAGNASKRLFDSTPLSRK